MEIITSGQNRLIKETKKLQQRKYREERKLFLVEGVRLVEEALYSGNCQKAFYSKRLLSTERGEALLQKLRERLPTKDDLVAVSPQVLKLLADTESDQGVLAIARQQDYELDTLRLGDRALLLVADSLQDPGNLGTMLRTAWCAGVDAVICLPGTVDPYNSKTVRASMGGIFHVPVIMRIGWEQVREWCRKQEVQLVAGDLQGQPYYSQSYADRVALVIGNEGQGLIQVKAEQLAARVTIPLAPGAESLNAAVACGVLLFHIRNSCHTLR